MCVLEGDRVLACNAAMVELLGVEDEAALLREGVLRGDGPRAMFEDIRGRALSEGELELEWAGERDDGSRLELKVRVTGLGPDQHLVAVQDVTHRRAIDRELEGKTQAIEASLNGFDIVDSTGAIVYANRAYLDMWGFDSLDEVIGASPADHCADSQTPRQIIEGCSKDGRCTAEFAGLRKDGTTFDVLMSVQRAVDRNGGTIFVGTSIDVTDLRKAERERERMREAMAGVQTAQAVANLAAGIAHDFNNMLSPILAGSQLLAGELRDEEQRQLAGAIGEAGLRCRDLTRQLLAISRRQVLTLESLDLREVVDDTRRLLRRTIREDIVVEVVPARTPVPVRADRGLLIRLLTNLSINAQDAMPEGGHMSIEVRSTTLHRDECQHVEGLEPGQFGELLVRDGGMGIDARTQARIFEPFFSTKGSAGHGLGLASVFGIVKQHGGHVWVQSEVGVGTQFRVVIPAAETVTSERKPEEPAPARGGEGSILVVEDDDMVRDLAARVLRRLGYATRVACNGSEALSILQSNAAVDLLLTDVIMPGMNGKELAVRARAVRPGLRVLYMSGYTSDVIGRHGVLEPGTLLIEKPFYTQDLANKVREALRGGAQEPRS